MNRTEETLVHLKAQVEVRVNPVLQGQKASPEQCEVKTCTLQRQYCLVTKNNSAALGALASSLRNLGSLNLMAGLIMGSTVKFVG